MWQDVAVTSLRFTVMTLRKFERRMEFVLQGLNMSKKVEDSDITVLAMSKLGESEDMQTNCLYLSPQLDYKFSNTVLI